MKKVPMTKKGYEALQKELDHLRSVERKEVIKAIASARELGDLSENAEYHAAREKQGFIEGRIAELEAKLSISDVIDTSTMSGDMVRFGAHVVIIDEETEQKSSYQIVGADESDVKKGLLSFQAPLARALIGKSSGDVVVARTPGGEKSYEILEVTYLA